MIGGEALIPRIYEAAAFPEDWPGVLEQLGRTVDTPGVVLLTHRSDAWIGCAVSRPLEPSMLAYLGTDIPGRSETTPRLLAKDWAGFLTDEDVFSRDEWEREPFRHEWARKWGWDHAAATAIEVPSGDFLVFHAQRKEGEPPFSTKDIAMLDAFRPHLARAGLLAARWRLQRLRAAAEALALLGLPAAILDRSGRVLAVNSLIEALTNHVRWLPRDRLALVDPQANTMLVRTLADLFDPTRVAAALSFPSRSGSGGTAVAHLIPTAGKARDIFDGALAVLAFTPITTPDAPSLPLIRALFDLSPSEARVARSLTQGQTIEEIAGGHGVAANTVRSQVKAIFAKTGTSRQAEVAALLAGLPRLPLK